MIHVWTYDEVSGRAGELHKRPIEIEFLIPEGDVPALMILLERIGYHAELRFAFKGLCSVVACSDRIPICTDFGSKESLCEIGQDRQFYCTLLAGFNCPDEVQFAIACGFLMRENPLREDEDCADEELGAAYCPIPGRLPIRVGDPWPKRSTYVVSLRRIR